MADTRAHVFVTGSVQGVHFRDNLHETARAHDVDGWARNLEDDRVEAVFEGAEGDVEHVVDWCKRGPPKAEVEGVNIEMGSPQGDLEGFRKVNE